MYKRIVPIVMIVVLALVTLACGATVNLPDSIKGNGDIVQETREVGSFDTIELRGLGQIYVEFGDEEALEVSGEENLLRYIETYTEGGSLVIEIEDNRTLVPTEKLEYFITVVELKELDVSGLGDIELPSIETDSFRVEISGAGNIDVDALNADTLDVRLGGLGDLTVERGEVNQLKVDISGSGNFNSRRMDSQEAEINISGLGSATVSVSEYLDVNISGGGSVNYYGSPEVDTEISGLGRLDHKGD